MAPQLEATSTATALEARETRYYYSNGRCGDKSIYACEPGIIYGVIGAVIIGLGVAAWACYAYRHTAFMRKVFGCFKRVSPSARRRRRRRRQARIAKSDVEMDSVDSDKNTVTSDSTAPEKPQTALTSNTRHARFDGTP